MPVRLRGLHKDFDLVATEDDVKVVFNYVMLVKALLSNLFDNSVENYELPIELECFSVILSHLYAVFHTKALDISDATLCMLGKLERSDELGTRPFSTSGCTATPPCRGSGFGSALGTGSMIQNLG